VPLGEAAEVRVLREVLEHERPVLRDGAEHARADGVGEGAGDVARYPHVQERARVAGGVEDAERRVPRAGQLRGRAEELVERAGDVQVGGHREGAAEDVVAQ
jgi:hypothetical protein